MRNQIRFIKDVLYSLTRDYGQTVIVKRTVPGNTDYATGNKTNNYTETKVKKVIRLPDQTSRLSNLDFVFRKFSLPALPDKRKRQFIFDSKNLPNEFVLEMDDVILMDFVEYKVTKIDELESKLGYYIEAEEII